MFKVSVDAQEGLSYYPENIAFQFYICHHKKLLCYLNATRRTMLHECFIKNENWLKFQGPNLEQTDRKVFGSRTLFYRISIMLQIFIEDSGNLKHPKNVKSINNTTVSHLVSCRVIPRPATMKGWEKEVFWKIHALGNLKCNKSNTLKSK